MLNNVVANFLSRIKSIQTKLAISQENDEQLQKYKADGYSLQLKRIRIPGFDMHL